MNMSATFPLPPAGLWAIHMTFLEENKCRIFSRKINVELKSEISKVERKTKLRPGA